MREFTKVDNERALDVGSLSRDTGTFQVRKRKVPEGCPEVVVRENSDQLTLRAEVGTSKALVRLLLGVVQRYRRKRLRRNVGVSKEATGSPESKSPLENEGSQGRRRRILRPMREEGIKGRNETRLALWAEHFKDPIVALDKALKCVEDRY